MHVCSAYLGIEEEEGDVIGGRGVVSSTLPASMSGTVVLVED